MEDMPRKVSANQSSTAAADTLLGHVVPRSIHRPALDGA